LLKLKVRFLNLVLTVLLSVFAGATPSFAQPADIQGHWAEKQIGDWVAKGLASGYPDGSFRPDNSITRAEFITLVNKSFGFTVQARIYFNDVSSTGWFYNEIAKAGAAGYISGYEDGSMRPENEISRQEVAVILTRLLKLKIPDSADELSKFADAGSFPRWSGGAVSAVVAGGYMVGYPDQTFQPAKSITRVEAVATLDRAKGAPEESGAVGKAFDKAGIYGPESGAETIEGDVTVSAGEEVKKSTPGASSGGGGGNSGGGGGSDIVDTVAPKITAAAVTVGGHEINAVIEGDGLSGGIDLSGQPENARITEGTIDVTRDSTLTLTVHNIPLSQKLTAGSNSLEAINLLSKFGKDGITLGEFEKLFGNPAVLNGTLKDNSSGNTYNVSLTITLP